MARIPNTNYQAAGTAFEIATATDDPFHRDDLYKLAEAFDLHTHDDTGLRGLPVGSVADDAVHGEGLQDDSVVDRAIAPITLTPTSVPTDNVGKLTDLFSEIAHQLKAIMGTTNWYDAPANNLTQKVNKAGDNLTGLLNISHDTTSGGFTGGVSATMYSRAAIVAAVDFGTHPNAFPAIGFHRIGVNAAAIYYNPSANDRFWYVDSNGSGGVFWTSQNMGVNSGLNADTVRSLIGGNSAGNLAIANGLEVSTLFATYARLASTAGGNKAFSNGSGDIPISNGVLNVNLIAAQATVAASASSATVAGSLSTPGTGNQPVGNAANQIPQNNSTLNTGLVAQEAQHATTADSATTAGSATTATSATSATNATNASNAAVAALLVTAGNGNQAGGNLAGQIPVSNGIQCNTLVAQTAAAISDVRTKRSMAALVSNPLDILSLRPISYHYTKAAQKKYGSTPDYQRGFVAQEVQTLYPEAIVRGPDELLALDYARLVVPIIYYLQHLEQRVQALEAQ